jgi:RNA polymerase sigma-70 factor (ECF subfamily)
LKINNLYRLALSGDKTSVDSLFQNLSERFQLFVQNRIWDKQDSEDIVQDALMTISEKYKEVESDTDFSSWAYKVLKNKILNYFRSQKYEKKRNIDLPQKDDPPAKWNPDPVLKRKIVDCMEKISKAKIKHAQILDLHYQGYTVEEICRKFDFTPNAFYIILSRARSMLKLCLEKGEIS